MSIKDIIKKIDSLDLDNQKLFAIGIALLILVFADVSFLFKAQITGFKKTASEAQKLKKDLDNFRLEYKNMQDVQTKKVQISRETLNKLKHFIPGSDMAGYLQSISSAAADYNVKIIQIVPVREDLQEKKKKKKDKDKPKEKDADFLKDNYAPVLIKIELSSDYHNFVRFMSALESMPVYIMAQSLKIINVENDLLNQKINIELRTYVKR